MIINNYKSQIILKAEMQTSITRGEPVNLFSEMDEDMVVGDNLITENIFVDSDDIADVGWVPYFTNTITTTSDSVRITRNSGAASADQGAYIYFRDGVNSATNTDLIYGKNYVLDLDFTTNDTNAFIKISGGGGFNVDSSVGNGHKKIVFTAKSTTQMRLAFDNIDNGKYVELRNISLYEAEDHTYKLIARNEGTGNPVTLAQGTNNDVYVPPINRYGVVSYVYDQNTGAMKTIGVAGDKVDVVIQGECDIIRNDGSTNVVVAGQQISRIEADGAMTDIDSDSVYPNSLGVVTETSSDTTAHCIIWQGVKFPEHFDHKHSLRVFAKCAESIEKFKPVSLYLDVNGDLLCRNDSIPEDMVVSDSDIVMATPGKWGISELAGETNELIPVTVAGKTHVNTSTEISAAGNLIRKITEDGVISSASPSNNNYSPNALGTIMGTSVGASESNYVDIPITIFSGTPTGLIEDYKKVTKVNAKAVGTIEQFCPVSLFLDSDGNYKCIADSIPMPEAGSTNGALALNPRKYGVSQNSASEGENVEIIVQGRTKYNNTVAGRLNSKIRCMNQAGTISQETSNTYIVSWVGCIESTSSLSTGVAGTIILY